MHRCLAPAAMKDLAPAAMKLVVDPSSASSLISSLQPQFVNSPLIQLYQFRQSDSKQLFGKICLLIYLLSEELLFSCTIAHVSLFERWPDESERLCSSDVYRNIANKAFVSTHYG